MKRILFALPLAAIVLSANAQTGGTTNTGSSTSDKTNKSSRFSGYDINKYDPNNYMQNPEKYKSPRELGKEGGWTYNNDWNFNNNFLSEALGQWMLTPSAEVAAFWIPDTSRAETYASYWTPEAVAARQQEKMMAQAAYSDSLAKAQGFSQATASRGKGKAGTRNTANGSMGSGSTGEMGSGGMNSSTSANTNTNGSTGNSTDMNAEGMNSPQTTSNTKNYLMAVNGNMFTMPSLNLYLQNGSFTGYTGSNQLVGTLRVNGTQLSFDQTIPSTNMEARGGFSQPAFMERLARVDSYDITGGQLRLKQGNEVLFVLAKNAQ